MWRQLKGLSDLVVVEMKGGCPERFINLCRFSGISMWNIRSCDGCVYANMSKKDFMKIHQHVRKSGVRVRVLKKRGMGFVSFRYRKHYSFVLGIFISLVLLKLMSLYVWNISFSGNTEYTDELLTKFLNEHSYKLGMRIEDINCDGIESSMRNQFENITWVSAEIRGTRLIIHIKENDGVITKAVDNKREQNSIYSDYDGVVVSVITRKGTPMVKKGDTVAAGDELVSGKIELKNDSGEVVSQEDVFADGQVVIKTQIKYTDTVNRVQEQKVYTGQTKTYSLLGASYKYIRLGIGKVKYKEYDCVTESDNMLLSEDFCLPVWYGKCTYYEYKTSSVELSDSQIENQLKERMITYLHKLEENNVQICSNRVNININSNSGIMEGIIEADVTEGSNNKR